jgi:hypothetical protein
MWQSLGLGLKARDTLLEILGKGCQDIYLAQKNRPGGMRYFDFVMSEVHGLFTSRNCWTKKNRDEKLLVPIQQFPVKLLHQPGMIKIFCLA